MELTKGSGVKQGSFSTNTIITDNSSGIFAVSYQGDAIFAGMDFLLVNSFFDIDHKPFPSGSLDGFRNGFIVSRSILCNYDICFYSGGGLKKFPISGRYPAGEILFLFLSETTPMPGGDCNSVDDRQNIAGQLREMIHLVGKLNHGGARVSSHIHG